MEEDNDLREVEGFGSKLWSEKLAVLSGTFWP